MAVPLLLTLLLLSEMSLSFRLPFRLLEDRRREALIFVPLLLAPLLLSEVSLPSTLFELIDRRKEALIEIDLLTPLFLSSASESESEFTPKICDIVSDRRIEDLNPDLSLSIKEVSLRKDSSLKLLSIESEPDLLDLREDLLIKLLLKLFLNPDESLSMSVPSGTSLKIEVRRLVSE